MRQLIDEREAARSHLKLPAGAKLPATAARNTRADLSRRLAPFRASGVLPDYPMGSDFTPVEQRLVRALGWLKARTGSTGARLKLIARALADKGEVDAEALARMDLARPSGLKQVLLAKLLAHALRRAAQES